MSEPVVDSGACSATAGVAGAPARPRPGAAVVLLALAAACASAPSAGPEPPCAELVLGGVPPEANLVLVVNDTMRRDRMGVYGGSARTPAFDGFAREHLLFEHAVTQSPWTKPSIATLFTGLHPSQHGVTDDPQLRDPRLGGGGLRETDVLSEALVTLAEVLQEAGFRTAAFNTNPWLARQFGFGQGFEVYDDSFAGWGADGEAVTAAALAWLAAQPAQARFFLYVHYLDSHVPYGRLRREEIVGRAAELAADRRPLPPGAVRALSAVLRLEDGRPAVAAGFPLTVGLVEMAYDRGVEDFDRALGRLLEGVARHPAHERTAVLVTSDHGEALFTRGYGNHGTGLFDDEVAIPLAARLPGATGAGGRVRCPVGLVDVMPSMCAYLGVACPPGLAGVPFVGRPGGEPPPARYLVTEGVALRPAHRAIRNRTFKLMWETGPRGDGRVKEDPYSLYDVSADPGETRDLLEGPRPRRVERVFRTMSAALAQAVPPFERPAKVYVPMDERTRERLEALGYAE
jgi:choline-sulfatase